MRHPDPGALKARAESLRREELRRIGCAAEVKWATFLRRFVLSLSKDAPHAPLPCQRPAPSHP